MVIVEERCIASQSASGSYGSPIFLLSASTHTVRLTSNLRISSSKVLSNSFCVGCVARQVTEQGPTVMRELLQFEDLLAPCVTRAARGSCRTRWAHSTR